MQTLGKLFKKTHPAFIMNYAGVPFEGKEDKRNVWVLHGEKKSIERYY